MRITSRTIWALWAVPVVMVAITYSRLPPAELYHVSRSGLGGGLGRAVVYIDFPVSLVAIALVAVTYSSLGHRWEARLATVSMLLCACVVVPGIVDQDRLDARPLNAVPALGVVIAVVLTVRSRWPGVRCSGRRGVVAVCLGVLSLPWLAAEAGFYLPGGIFESGELVREPGEPGLVRAVHLGDHHGLSAVMLIVTALALWFAPRGHPRTFGRRATQAYLALMLSYGVVNAVQDFWGEQIAARGWTDWYIPDAVQPGATPIWVVIVLGAVLADRLPRSSVPHERANPLLRRFPNPPLRGGDVIVENGTHVITGVSRAPRYGLYAAGGGPTAMHIELTTTEPSKNWQDEANCLGVDPDLFFPERGASTREAKEVCRGCTVRLDCLEYALVNGEKFGIWGGLSERERRRLRRQRAQATRRTSA